MSNESDDRILVREPFDLALVEHYSKKRDDARYRRLIDAGVAAGDCLAQYALATAYLFGDRRLGVKKDLAKAIALLRKAAPTLNRAAYDLGVCYARGIGVKRNESRAYELFESSANLGCIEAMIVQAEYLIEGTGVRRQTARGRKLLRRAESLIALYEDGKTRNDHSTR
jgi:TPR repeat protein